MWFLKMAETASPEAILKNIGGCGRFQGILCVLMHLMRAPTVCSTFVVIFSIATPKWWCADDLSSYPMSIENYTGAHTWTENISLTLDSDRYKNCKFNNGSTCRTFVYDESMNTIYSEWDMVCTRKWIPAMIGSVQMGGLFFGSLICGHVADLMGRKTPLFMSLIGILVGNIMGYFSYSWEVFAVARVICGLSMGWFLALQFTLMAETTLSKIRPLVVAMPSWPLITCVACLVAYLIPDWRQLHLVMVILTVPFLATWWFIPESFRWYISHERLEEASNVIKYIAKVNGHDISDAELSAMLQDISKEEKDSLAKQKRYSVLDLFKKRRLAKLTLLLFLDWFALGLVSYCILFGVQALSGSFYLNNFIFSVITVPLCFIAIVMCNKIGRRECIMLCYLISAVGSIIVGIVQYIDTDHRGKITNAMAILSMLGIGTAWGPCSTLTMELYPTVVRNIGFGFMSMSARLGAVIAPQLAYLDTEIPGLMYFVCGAVAALCVAGTFMLEETKGKNLHDKMSTTVTKAPSC